MIFKDVVSIFLVSLLPISTVLHAQTGINTTNPDPNAVLDITSTVKGVLIPRLTGSQVSTLAGNSPVEGMLVYNSDEDCVQLFVSGAFQCLTTALEADGTKDAWVDDPASTSVKLGSTSTGATRPANSEVVINDSGNVGVGTATPQRKLHVVGGTQLSGELNVGGNANTAGSSGSAGQVLTSKGASAAPEWKSVGTISGTIASASYIQGTGALNIASGVTADVPGVTFTHTVPAGSSQTLLFTIVGYAKRTTTVIGESTQGAFSLIQGTTKISSAYATSIDGGVLDNLPVPATLLRAVTLSPGTYTFKVQYSAWYGAVTVNNNPNSNTAPNSAYAGATSADTEAMLTKMQVLVYNN